MVTITKKIVVLLVPSMNVTINVIYLNQEDFKMKLLFITKSQFVYA